MMFAPAARKPGADAVEQSLAVGSEDADPGRAAVGIVLDDDVRLRLADMRFGGGDLPRIRELPCRRLGEPVAVGQAAGMSPRRAGLPAEFRSQLLLALLDDGAAAMLLVAKTEPFLRGLEQGPKQGALPIVPHARTDSADVDHGQDQQQPQALGALHLANEILDRLWIGEVALERGRREQKVMAD